MVQNSKRKATELEFTFPHKFEAIILNNNQIDAMLPLLLPAHLFQLVWMLWFLSTNKD